MDQELVEKMKVLLASTFAAYLKAHAYHWNVVGQDFPQLHDFFATVYEDYHGAVDPLAEHIRQLDAFAPQTLTRMKELSVISEDEKVLSSEKMVASLKITNESLMKLSVEVYEMAEEKKMFGLSNYLQDRITSHSKLNWMLTSILLKKTT